MKLWIYTQNSLNIIVAWNIRADYKNKVSLFYVSVCVISCSRQFLMTTAQIIRNKLLHHK